MQVSIESLREFVAQSNHSFKAGCMSPADKLRARGFSEQLIQASIIMIGYFKLNRENEGADQLQISTATVIATALLKIEHLINTLHESETISSLVIKGIVYMQGRDFSESVLASEKETLVRTTTDEIEALLLGDAKAIKRFYSYLIANATMERLSTSAKDGFAGVLLLLSSALEIKLPQFLVERLITRTVYHKHEEVLVVRKPVSVLKKTWLESNLYFTIDSLCLDVDEEPPAKKRPCEEPPMLFSVDALPESVASLYGFFNKVSRRKLTFKHTNSESITVSELSYAMGELRRQMRSLRTDDSMAEDDKHALSIEIYRLGRQIGKLKQGISEREPKSISFR